MASSNDRPLRKRRFVALRHCLTTHHWADIAGLWSGAPRRRIVVRGQGARRFDDHGT